MGPFTALGAWSLEYQLSGRSAVGDDCTSSTAQVAFGFRDKTGQMLDKYYTVGFGASQHMQFSSTFGNLPANMNSDPLTLVISPPAGCSWTVTFG